MSSVAAEVVIFVVFAIMAECSSNLGYLAGVQVTHRGFHVIGCLCEALRRDSGNTG